MTVFYDFVDAGGQNVIHDWLDAAPATVKAKIQKRLGFLEATPQADWGGARYVAALTGDAWDGVFEIRIRAGNVQYRPLFCYGPGREQATLLCIAEERGGRIEPSSAARVSRERRRLIQEEQHVCRHDFS